MIKKKLVRKTLDMIKKIDNDKYGEFWKEYSTNLKLGVIEDTANRTRLAKLLRFVSSSTGGLTSLAEYVERTKVEFKIKPNPAPHLGSSISFLPF